jgi:hypothetical protein
MMPFPPPPPGNEVEPATLPFEMPPVRRPWLVLAGLALPFTVVAVGWWIADTAASGRNDDAWWDTAGAWVFRGLIAALFVAVGACMPVFRRIQFAS